VRSNPGGIDIFPTCSEGHEAHPISSAVGIGSFPWVKRPRPYFNQTPDLAPMLNKEYSCNCIGLLCLHGRLQGQLYLYLYVQAEVRKGKLFTVESKERKKEKKWL
jgi:hypothetical protein